MRDAPPGARAKVHHAALLPPTFAGVPVSFVMGWSILLMVGGLLIMGLSRPPGWRTLILAGFWLTGMALIWMIAWVATKVHPHAVEMGLRWCLLPTHLGNR
jgi:hypothetical protein